jgi:hypothetical protein
MSSRSNYSFRCRRRTATDNQTLSTTSNTDNKASLSDKQVDTETVDCTPSKKRLVRAKLYDDLHADINGYERSVRRDSAEITSGLSEKQSIVRAERKHKKQRRPAASCRQRIMTRQMTKASSEEKSALMTTAVTGSLETSENVSAVQK